MPSMGNSGEDLGSVRQWVPMARKYRTMRDNVPASIPNSLGILPRESAGDNQPQVSRRDSFLIHPLRLWHIRIVDHLDTRDTISLFSPQCTRWLPRRKRSVANNSSLLTCASYWYA